MIFSTNNFPIFDLGDVILREINPRLDAKDFYSYIRKKEVADFVPAPEVPKNLDEATEELNYWYSLFRQRRSIFWAIECSITEKFIGMAGCNSFSNLHSRAEISYDLNYDFWGKGIMKRSLTEIINFLHQDLGTVRTQATVAINNERSIKLLESLNFQKEGIMQKYALLNGKHIDYYMYGYTTKK
jgi:ribosomal-protein-alanine N-acetyltransferase